MQPGAALDGYLSLDERLREWFDCWRSPVVRAMYHKQYAAAREALSAAHAELARGRLRPEDAEAVAVQFDYLDFHIDKAELGPEAARERFQAVLARLEQPAASAVAEAVRLRLLTQLLISADRSGWCELPTAELTELFEKVPACERTAELWYFITGWAFLHQDLGYLEQAHEYQLTHGREFVAEWAWHRAHLMYLLLTAKARREDVRVALAHIAIEQPLREFERYLWPLIQRAGLDDDGVRELYDKRRSAIESGELTLESAGL